MGRDYWPRKDSRSRREFPQLSEFFSLPFKRLQRAFGRDLRASANRGRGWSKRGISRLPRVESRIVDQRAIAFTAGHAGDAVSPFGFGTAFGLGAFAVAGIYGLRRDDDRLVQHLLHRLG